MREPHDDIALTGGGRTTVHRRGQIVLRGTGPWTATVHTLLRHLERVGFEGAPRLVGSGLDRQGREMLTFIEGEFTHPGPWSVDGAAGPGVARPGRRLAAPQPARAGERPRLTQRHGTGRKPTGIGSRLPRVAGSSGRSASIKVRTATEPPGKVTS